jgi:protocatechuate 3,4-dioxygenase beta subunit
MNFWRRQRLRIALFFGTAVLMSTLVAPASIRPLPRAQTSQNPNPPAQTNTTGEEGFKIAGTVVNAVTGAALARVEVTLADTRNRTRRIAMITDETGRFEFVAVPPGKYSLEGAKRGYLTAAYQQHEQYSTAIVTGPQFETDKLVLRLMPMAMIFGHVLDESGEPVRHARVQLFMEDHSAGMSRVTGAGNSTSDDRGYFDINVLRPGTYFLSVTATPWYALHPVPAVSGDVAASRIPPELDVAYPTTYYGGATESDSAAPIELKGGEQRELDIRLTPVPALHFTFQIPTGKGNQDGQFQMPMLQKRVFDSTEFVPPQVFQPSPGMVEMSGLAPGRYELRSVGTDGAVQLSEIDLEHSGQDLNQSESTALGKLKLTLKMAGNLPLPKQYAVRLHDAKQKVVAYQPGDPAGQVTFEGVRPGKYTIVVASPEARFAVTRTISPSGEAISGQDVNIASGAAMELTAELAVGEVRVEGIAEKNGQAVSGVMVALVPKNPDAHLALFRRDQSDLDGTFSLPGVIPGTYTVVAVEDAWGFEWMKPGVLARYVQHGQTVTVADGITGVLRLPQPLEVQAK